MITDNTSSVAPDMVKNLISGLDANSLSKKKEKSCCDFKSWKGTNNTEDVAPTIYNKLVYMYLKTPIKMS
jgi:penicillin amidase